MIYVIQPGDTLDKIARRYGVSLTNIQNLNPLPNPERLIIGQAILIPELPPEPLQYTVITGDTLFRLAQDFNIPVQDIATANNISNSDLIQTGTVLTIPGWSQTRYIVRPEDTLYAIASRLHTPLNLVIRVNRISNSAFIFPGQILSIPRRSSETAPKSISALGYFHLSNLNGLSRSLTAIGHDITYGAVFQFPVAIDGSITIPGNIEKVVTIFKGLKTKPLVSLTNWGLTGFEPRLARTILGDPEKKGRVIHNLLSLLKHYDFAGVNIDFENMFAEDRQLLTTFINDIASTLKPQGFMVSISVAPKFSDLPTANWVGAFDYAALGRLADFVFLMTYEWGWIGGPPMAIAPINLVRRALDYAVNQIPPAKILQGVPFYGYNWPLPHTPEKPAIPVNLVEVYNLAYRFHAVINYDAVAQAPWFRYTDENGEGHEVWFEDLRSIEAKYLTAREWDLGGVGWWSYINEPYGFPQNWPLLEKIFTVISEQGADLPK